MTSKASCYDALLRFQAELSFDLEQMFFRASTAWRRARRVLDFGAGNGHYTKLLAERNTDKEFTCVERDPELAERARALTRQQQIEVIEGSYTEVPKGGSFDFVLARHVMSYLSDRRAFMNWINAQTSDDAAVLTIDADDSALLTLPPLPLLESGNNKFKDDVHAKGGERTLADKLPSEWREHSFVHVETRGLVVHSEMVGRKPLMYLFMKQVAMMDHGDPLPPPVSEELDNWIRDPTSYLQYGLFGSVFEKHG